jgi:hypothetical protein
VAQLLVEPSPASTQYDLDIRLDGANARDLRQVFLTLSRYLNFPNYAHANLNSIEECINDLSWLPASVSTIRIRIDNYDTLLTNEPILLTELLCLFRGIDLPATDNTIGRKIVISIEATPKAIEDIRSLRC